MGPCIHTQEEKLWSQDCFISADSAIELDHRIGEDN